MTRLENKGHVVSDKSDLAHVFRARITRERVSRSRLRTLLDQLYDGAAGPLVLQLIRDERLSADDLTELQTLIDQLDTNKTKRKRTKPKTT